MSFEVAPNPGDRGEPDVRIGRSGGAAIGEDRRLVHDGVQVLARGALVCPSCALPIAPAPRIAPRAALSCAFCNYSGEARRFLSQDRIDTSANDAALIARLR
jgi:hypothetical protein